MELAVTISTGAVILGVYFILRAALGIRLRYGTAGLFLVLIPHSIGAVRPYGPGTFAANAAAAVAGILLIAAYVSKNRSP